MFSRTAKWIIGASVALSTLHFSYQSHLTQDYHVPPLHTTGLFGKILRSSNFRHSIVHADKQPNKISYLDAKVSKLIDDKLTTSSGFTFDQLMELAGLSVANAVQDYASTQSRQINKVLIICGPGNNGGDGLVAARHLSHFGFSPSIVYSKVGKAPIFKQLVTQCKELEIPILESFPESLGEYDLIIDALFGYSFQGPAKSPSNEIITKLALSPIPVLSVDIPSGWHVELGDIYHTSFNPAAVISLTAPKKCMENYNGIHYLGGRFIPPSLLNELNISLPRYRGTDQILRLDSQVPDPKNKFTDWQLYISDEGYPYFYNENIQESQWAQIQVPPVHSVLLSTASSIEEGRSIASHLVAHKLVACVNIVPSITSIYEWDGKVEESTEVMLVIKTRSSLVDEVTKAIKEKHSYSVPEVISYGITGGNQDYLDWISSETKNKKGERK